MTKLMVIFLMDLQIFPRGLI